MPPLMMLRSSLGRAALLPWPEGRRRRLQDGLRRCSGGARLAERPRQGLEERPRRTAHGGIGEIGVKREPPCAAKVDSRRAGGREATPVVSRLKHGGLPFLNADEFAVRIVPCAVSCVPLRGSPLHLRASSDASAL